jgi:hypothetical protein
MVSEKYYLAVNILFDVKEKKIIDEEDKNNLTNIYITSTDGKKTIFKREVEEWLLKPMNNLLIEDKEEFMSGYKHKPFRNSIFVLFGLFAYIEKMELYRGNGIPNDSKSTKRLVDGIKRIFVNLQSEEDNHIKDILKRSRHNLVHQAMIGDDILLNLGIDGSGNFNDKIGFSNALDIVMADEKQEIRINPIKMYDKIEKDFNDYLLLIDSNDDIKDKFESFFNKVYKYEIDLINS